MTSEVVFPLGNYADGLHTFGPLDVGPTEVQANFEMLRCTSLTPELWPSPDTKVTTVLEYNVGNGWEQVMSGEGWGGVSQNKFGQDIPSDNSGFTVPSGETRQVRGSIEVENGPCRTQCTMSVT